MSPWLTVSVGGSGIYSKLFRLAPYMYGHTKMLNREGVTSAIWKEAKHVFTWFLRLNILESSVWTNTVLQHNWSQWSFFYSGRTWSGKKIIWKWEFGYGKTFCYLNNFWIWCFCQTLFRVFRVFKLIKKINSWLHLLFPFPDSIFLPYQFSQSRKRPLTLVTLVTYGQLNFYLKGIQLLRYTTSHNLS